MYTDRIYTIRYADMLTIYNTTHHTIIMRIIRRNNII